MTEQENQTNTITFEKGKIALTYPSKYSEGYSLKANEAKALNRVLAENVGNNLRSFIKEAIEKAGSAEAVDQAALQAKLDEYIATYEFGSRKVSAGGGKKSDPISTVARAIATAMLKEALAGKGHKFSEVKKANPDMVKNKIDELSKREDIVARATEQVQANQAAAKEALDIDNLL